MKILVIDDDSTCNEFLTLFFQDEGYEVQSAISASQALQIAEEFSPDLLVADWLLKDGMDGVEVAQRLQQQYPRLHVIFTTGSPAEQLESQIVDLEVLEIIEKPIEIEELLGFVRKVDLQAA